MKPGNDLGRCRAFQCPAVCELVCELLNLLPRPSAPDGTRFRVAHSQVQLLSRRLNDTLRGPDSSSACSDTG